MIRHFLNVSSGHLSPETWTWLDTQLADDTLRDPGSGPAALIAGGPTRYGWFVYAPEDTLEDFPPDLTTVLRKARAEGAEYVLFDCDAPSDPDLPVFPQPD